MAPSLSKTPRVSGVGATQRVRNASTRGSFKSPHVVRAFLLPEDAFSPPRLLRSRAVDFARAWHLPLADGRALRAAPPAGGWPTSLLRHPRSENSTSLNLSGGGRALDQTFVIGSRGIWVLLDFSIREGAVFTQQSRALHERPSVGDFRFSWYGWPQCGPLAKMLV